MKQHDIISALYSLREMIQCHLTWLKQEEGLCSDVREARNVEVLEKTCSQLDRNLRLTRELNSVLRAEADVAREGKSVDVRDMWQHVIRAVRQEKLLGDIEVIEQIPKCFPPVHGSPLELEEIFYHLVKNACYASPSGKIIIRAQASFTACESSFALISVVDTGIGIPQERLCFLFEPFYTTKPWGKGNGLGLWIVKQLIQKNDGRISVQTFEGCGTTFQLGLPFAKSSPEKRFADEVIGYV